MSVKDVYVKAAVPNVAAGTITIILNRTPGTAANPRSVTVAWFLVN
jgi:hypothetical protein